ncbi:MAG: hypothetical protein HY898_14425 [Deltaproteobacteria bacterium]|nr:hypothetical protein [Deltaproteobacteria bacterium]
MDPQINKLLDRAVDTVREMQAAGGRRVSLLGWSSHATTDLPNELILFVKPEITRPDHAVQIRSVLEMLASTFDDYGIEVSAMVVLGAEYLRDHDLIAQHYGVINEVSRLGLDALQPASAAKALAMRKGSEPVLGGHQILARNPKLTPQGLGALWDKGSGTKVGSGAYAQRFRIGSEDIVGLNGFHPMQITHFTEPGRSIVVMAIRSKASWRALRQAFLGATNPEKAMEGSFRRRLLADHDKLGIPQVNQGLNGAHLSAGPLEGLAEILRYFTDFDRKQPLDPSLTVMGSSMIRAGFSTDEIARLLKNARLYTAQGKLAPAFDLTEEMDWRQAVDLLKQSARRNE